MSLPLSASDRNPPALTSALRERTMLPARVTIVTSVTSRLTANWTLSLGPVLSTLAENGRMCRSLKRHGSGSPGCAQ